MDNEIARLTAHIVSAHVSNNDVSTDQLPLLIRNVHQALTVAAQARVEPSRAGHVVEADQSVFADRIVCLVCGESFKTLKRHIAVYHHMTPDEYRAKWGLQPSYPMISADYAAMRSKVAQANGLGKTKKAAAPPKRRGRPERM